MWFEHNDMDDLERLLREQKEKDDKVNVKQIDYWLFNSLFSSQFPHLLATMLAYVFECRPTGSFVLKVLVVGCQSIPLIDLLLVLHWHLGWHLIDTWSTSRSTVNSFSIYAYELVDTKLTMVWLDQVSISFWPSINWDVNQAYWSMVSINTWLPVPMS